MNPTVRYDLLPGEWRPDAPRVSYTADRSQIAALLEEALRAQPWTSGEADAGPSVRRSSCLGDGTGPSGQASRRR